MSRRANDVYIIVGLGAGGSLGAAVAGPAGAIAGAFVGGLAGMGLDQRNAAPPEWRYH